MFLIKALFIFLKIFFLRKMNDEYNFGTLGMHCSNKCLLFIWMTKQNLVYPLEIADWRLAFAPFNHVDSYRTM